MHKTLAAAILAFALGSGAGVYINAAAAANGDFVVPLQLSNDNASAAVALHADAIAAELFPAGAMQITLIYTGVGTKWGVGGVGKVIIAPTALAAEANVIGKVVDGKAMTFREIRDAAPR